MMTVFLPRLVWWPKPGAPPKQAPYWRRLPELHRNQGNRQPLDDFHRHNARKTGHCKENYETDMIGDSRRNRTGTASDTKAVATAIMDVGRCRPCPLGLGGFGCDWMRQADLHRHGTAAFASMRHLVPPLDGSFWLPSMNKRKESYAVLSPGAGGEVTFRIAVKRRFSLCFPLLLFYCSMDFPT